MINSGFAESVAKTITLPEDDPDAVKAFFDWLYNGTVHFDEKNECGRRFTNFGAFADKVCEEAYVNDCMDALVCHYQEKATMLGTGPYARCTREA